MGGFLISPLPPVSVKELQNSRAPSLRGRYPASPLLRAPPPPSRLRPTSRGRRDTADLAPPLSRRGGEGFSPGSPAPGRRRPRPPPPPPAAPPPPPPRPAVPS